MSGVSPESLVLIHGLSNSREFMRALKEICDDMARVSVDSTRTYLRADLLNLARQSEAQSQTLEDFPLMWKSYADKYSRK